MKRLFCFVLGILLTSSLIYGISQHHSIENEFIKIVVNNEDALGRFSLETTLGSPDSFTDDYQDLIYGKPSPWTSYSTVLIDGKPFIFGNEDARLKRRTKKEFDHLSITEHIISENYILSIAESSPISVTQRCEFYRNPLTNVNDSMLISYTFTNTDAVTHNIGLRIMLDTKLGPNDGAPIRMGNHAISEEIKLYQDDLFHYWQAFDTLVSPNIISQGILKDSVDLLTVPNSIHVANWGTLVDSPWDVPYEKGRSFIRTGEKQKDTALALYYTPIALPPFHSHTLSTVYGLGGLSLSKGEISAGLSAPKVLSASQKKPFLMMGYILNSGGYDALNVTATFTLPDYLSIVKGQMISTYSILKANEQIQIPLLVKLNTTQPKKDSLYFSVTSDTFETAQISRPLTVLASPTLQLSFPRDILIPTDSTHVIVRGKVSNTSFIPISDVKVTLSSDTPVYFPPFEKASKSIDFISPYSSQEISWLIHSGDSPPPLISVSSRSKQSNPSHRSISLHRMPSPTPLLSLFSPPVAPQRFFSLKIDVSQLKPDLLYELPLPPSIQFVRSSVDSRKELNIRYDENKRMLLVTKNSHHNSPYILCHFEKLRDDIQSLSILHEKKVLDTIYINN
ncbi:hypothetical protein DID78_04630 [Candidatus Marinamargulisbacteria bacterium SCGC AG-343-D04]|nr:hypothetical protein DID78_04630 [Candidatus Marinamargulisbacteria bacterium SCGC AG-343-D04]